MKLSFFMHAQALALIAAIGGATLPSTTAATPQHSLGTLIECTGQSVCWWAGEHGELVDGQALRELMVKRYLPTGGSTDRAHRNLESHMNYIEDVYTYAQSLGHTFPYRLGVHQRHLLDTRGDTVLPQVLVHNEMKAGRSTRGRQLATTPSEFNWCTTDNPKKRSVCTGVKSQENCGSCWAFAASDAIETAVAIAANQATPIALSPQQFLSCSNRSTEETFTYCWADNGVSGSPWLDSSIRWTSSNKACQGGMTHGAFIDAAQLQFGLLPEIVMPYTEENVNSTTSSSTCVRRSDKSVATISGWNQVVGKDCSVSKDPSVLLRNALQAQPIAVAIKSSGLFKDYKGGFYTCPDNGDFATKDEVNHALVLVGYGTDASVGDYWILKNSYGAQWGDKGYMKLVADKKINCGLNIFPVVPTGAMAGTANVTVDGGGEKKFVGLSPSSWIVVAIVVSLLTIALTIGGVFYSRKRMVDIRAQATGETEYDRNTVRYN